MLNKLRLPLGRCKSPWQLKAISGDPLKVIGEVSIPLSVFNTTLEQTFIVVEKGLFPGDLLVGFRFLAKHGIDIHPASATLSRDNCSIPLIKPPTQDDTPILPVHSTWTPHSDSDYATVSKDTLLQPCAASLVEVKLSSPGKSVLLTPDGVRVKGLVVEPAIYKPVNNKLVLRLLNATSHTIKLRRNTRVVDLEISNLALQVEDVPHYSVCTVQADGSADIPPPVLELPQVGLIEAIPILRDLLTRYRQILPATNGVLGSTDAITHTIELLPGSKPAYIPAYRLPHSRKEVLANLTQDMLSQGIIEPSSSAWNSPILLIPKRDGTFRPVIDYRQLNKLTVPDRFPIPILKDLLQDIGAGHTIFSTIDLSKGFWQVNLDKQSRPYTAFTTPKGHFQFKRMPFGLRNSPITFSRLMSITMSGLVGPTCLLYLDDLIIASKTVEEHTAKLEAVFKRLADAGLTINPNKCSFFQSSIHYLGHIVDHQGLRPNNGKIVAITDFPQPKNARDIKSFLGLIGFYRPFIKGFGKIAIPLTNMLCQDVLFDWSKEAEHAFHTLKVAITQAPVLIFPHYDLPFELTTDASMTGLGAVLMQRVNGKLHPIAFASRKTTGPESRYTTTDQEMLAIIWSLKHFREILFGYPITVFTDHQPLIHMCKDTKNIKGRHARWSNTIIEFNPTLKYTPGATNNVADALSRCHETSLCALQVVDFEELQRSQRTHVNYSKIIDALEKPPAARSRADNKLVGPFYLVDDLLFKRSGSPGTKKGKQRNTFNQLVITEEFIPIILNLLHEAPHSAHQGIDKAIKEARSKYYFPKQHSLITEHIKACQLCPYFKGHTSDPAPILSYDIVERPFQRVSMDLLSGFVTSEKGNKCLLVCIDNFTRYTELVPLPDKSAETVAKAFNESIICRHDSPDEILTDNGSEFVNRVIECLCNLLKIKQIRIMPYRPQANGLTERLNRSILNVMRTLVPDDDYNWDDKIPDVQSAINSSFHASLGDIPHFVLYGMDKRLPYEVLDRTPDPLYTDDYVPALLRRKQVIYQTARDHLLKEKASMNEQQHKLARRKSIEVGILVFHKLRVKVAPMPKLAPAFTGPFRVLEVKNNKAFLKNLATGHESWSHFDELKLATKEYQDRYHVLSN